MLEIVSYLKIFSQLSSLSLAFVGGCLFALMLTVLNFFHMSYFKGESLPSVNDKESLLSPVTPKTEHDAPKPTMREVLMAEINQGKDITKGLKKVTAEAKNSNRPSEEDVVPPEFKSNPITRQQQQQPRLELNGKKWMVEHYRSRSDPAVVEVAVEKTSHSVYIYNCEGSTVKIEGKCSSIVVDNCKKTAVVFDSVISSVEFINCQSVQMQVLGCVPTISVDKTDGCQMFLSKESLGTSLVTARSSAMNVMIPTEDDDFVEQTIPEQFKTTISGKALTTTAAKSTTSV